MLVYGIVRSFLNFRRAQTRRVYITVRALVSLAVWFLASWSWFFMFWVTAYTAAGNGSAADEERLDALTLLLLDLVYVLIGGGLALWVRHKSDKGR